MKFKTWLEIVELKNPKGVRKSTIIKDKGTNLAKPSIQFRWKTKLGNDIRLQFDIDGINEYKVVFYVNNTLYDDAASNTNNGRDPEILSGIFYLLMSKADKLGAQKINFRGHQSENDTKIVRGLNFEQYKPKLLELLNQFESVVQNHQVQMVPPSQYRIDLFKKLNRGVPVPTPDFNKNAWQNWIKLTINAVQNNERLIGNINGLKTGIGNGDFSVLHFDFNNLVDTMTNFSNAVESNSPEGWTKTRNRRTAIYTKLVNRYMADKWDVEIRGDWFYLTRKSL